CDACAVVEDVGRPKIVVDELLVSRGWAAINALRVGRHRIVEGRQQLARFGNLGQIADIEQSAVDDWNDAYRDVVQLHSKTAVSPWNRSSDRDASAGVKPEGEGCYVGQPLEQPRDYGQFRDEAPVIRRDPRQQVSVTDD